MADGFKYRAFISYAHADEAWAKWLHQRLERYRVPSRLVGRAGAHGTVPKRIGRCFRDQAELSAAPHLSETLQQALRDSQSLIVVCSPRSASSHWVNEEIVSFRSLGKGASILALVVDGEPNAKDPLRECFPPALRDAEPLAADGRESADGKADAFLKLVAGILGVGFDELRQRERRRRTRIAGAVVAASLSIAAVTSILAITAYRARDEARRALSLAELRREQADDLLQFMLGNLTEKLEPIGKLSILDAVAEKALDHFAATGGDDLSDSALRSKVKALLQIAAVRFKQGNIEGAVPSMNQALATVEELVRRNPDQVSALSARAEVESQFEIFAYYKRDADQADVWGARVMATYARLRELDPQDDHWKSAVAEEVYARGATEFQRGNLQQAKAAFEKAASQMQPLVDKAPGRRDYANAMALIVSGLWGVALAEHDYHAAVARAQDYASWRRRILAFDPENADALSSLVAATLTILQSQGPLRVLTPDDPALQEALATSQKLAKLDAENAEYAKNRTLALHYHVTALAEAGRLDESAAASEALLKLAGDLQQRAPEDTEVLRNRLAIIGSAIEIALLRKDRATVAQQLRVLADLITTHQPRDPSAVAWWLKTALLRWELAEPAQRAALEKETGQWLEQARKSSPVSAASMMRYEALRGDREQALQWKAKLEAPVAASVFTRRFCRAHGLEKI